MRTRTIRIWFLDGSILLRTGVIGLINVWRGGILTYFVRGEGFLHGVSKEERNIEKVEVL